MPREIPMPGELAWGAEQPDLTAGGVEVVQWWWHSSRGGTGSSGEWLDERTSKVSSPPWLLWFQLCSQLHEKGKPRRREAATRSTPGQGNCASPAQLVELQVLEQKALSEPEESPAKC